MLFSARLGLRGIARLGQPLRLRQPLYLGQPLRFRFPGTGCKGTNRSRASSSSSSTSSLRVCMAAFPLAFLLDTQPHLSLAPTAAPEHRPPPGPRLPLDPELASQISKGSFLGFVAGLLVSVFSRTLVLLVGVAIMFQSVAARLGVDLVDTLQLKERVNSSRILAALSKDTALKLSFGLAFTLAAFAHF